VGKVAVTMHNDSAAILDDLLIRWWNWKAPIQPARGFAREAVGLEGYRTSRQYDDQNGALYDDEEASIMRAVEREVNQLESDHRIILYVQARALTIGCMVFISPRLPQDRAEREAILQSARAALTIRLLAAGVM
jgi:hypothetical protein